MFRWCAVVLCLAACSRSRAVKPPPPAAPDTPASAPVTEAAPIAPGTSCSTLLSSERALPPKTQLDAAHDKALLAAVARCERYLFEKGGKKLRQATGDATPLYSVPDDALQGLAPLEVHSYVALLNRFALVGDLRRQLYYGPRLRSWFERIAAAPSPPCSDLAREAALYFSATPESLGGDTAWAKRLTERCPGR